MVDGVGVGGCWLLEIWKMACVFFIVVELVDRPN